MEKTAIDLEALRSKYKEDSLPHHLWSTALDCKRRRDAFWRHSLKMKLYNNLVSIPLLILSSITGLTSVAQLGAVSTEVAQNNEEKPNITMPIVVTVFGVSSAILTALQKYFRYAERAEHSKHMAKSYGRVARRIENTMVLVESSAIKMEPATFLKFVEEVQKDTDSLMQEIDDIPKELINSKDIYKNILESNTKPQTQPHFEETRQVAMAAREVPTTVSLNDLQSITAAAQQPAHAFSTSSIPSATHTLPPHPKAPISEIIQRHHKLHDITKNINILEIRRCSPLLNSGEIDYLSRKMNELEDVYNKEKTELNNLEKAYHVTDDIFPMCFNRSNSF